MPTTSGAPRPGRRATRHSPVVGALAAIALAACTGGCTSSDEPASQQPGHSATKATPPPPIARQLDLNDDHYGDLVIGIPERDGPLVAGGHGRRYHYAGEVAIYHGTPDGLPAKPDERLYPRLVDRDNILFGIAVEVADLNRDGLEDIAVGISGAPVGGADHAGEVEIFYGTRSGYPARGSLIHQGNPEAWDRYGASLASGDFNGDRRRDLAVGAPTEDVGDAEEAGAVSVHYGTEAGIDTRSQTLTQPAPEPDDHFGNELAAGYFNQDSFRDLAVAADSEDVGTRFQAGAVTVHYGSATGVTNSRVQLLLAPARTELIFFGSSLAVGDFDGDREQDLAVGATGQRAPNGTEAGAVDIFYGNGSGLDEKPQALYQSSSRVGSETPPADPVDATRDEDGDFYGDSLLVADLDRDNYDDLVVSAVDDNTGFGIGVVTVHFGDPDGAGLGVHRADRLVVLYTSGSGGGSLNRARMFAGRYNAGGRPDLVLGDAASGLRVFLGRARDPRFQPPPDLTLRNATGAVPPA